MIYKCVVETLWNFLAMKDIYIRQLTKTTLKQHVEKMVLVIFVSETCNQLGWNSPYNILI